MKYNHQPSQLFRTGVGEMAEQAVSATRTPAGHPEGYLEAFGNIYSDFAKQILAAESNQSISSTVPGIDQAIRGMAFIENAVSASQSETKWHPFHVDKSSLAE